MAADLVHVQETCEDSDVVVCSKTTCVSVCTFVPVKQVALCWSSLPMNLLVQEAASCVYVTFDMPAGIKADAGLFAAHAFTSQYLYFCTSKQVLLYQ